MKNFKRDKKSDRFQNDNSRRFQRDDSPSFEGQNSRFERRNEERPFEKRMYSVICAKCGERCEVPFRPRENKPVYCSACFRKNDNYESPPAGPSKSEFDKINEKLDKIMEALDIE